MSNIMASAVRIACVLAVALVVRNASASTDDLPSNEYSPLPSGYSLSYDREQWNEEYSVFHLAVAEPIGTFASGFAASVDPRLKPLTRLDSAWTVTPSLSPLPIRIGDGVSSVGFWDQPARMGGLQIGTVQSPPPEVIAPPSLIASPYQATGPAALATPRFMDHLRSMIQYQEQSLTPAGQTDFSLESGRLRENFELRSNEYGPWITSGSYRYGLSSATTLDGQVAQVAGQQDYLGVGVLEGLGSLGLISARVGGSRDQDSTGWLARFGYDFRADRYSFAIRSHIQSSGYQDLGDPTAIDIMKQRTLATAGVNLGSFGMLSLASATQTNIDDSHRDVIAVSHALPFGGGGLLSTAAAYSPGQYGSSALWLSFTYPLTLLDRPPRRLDDAAHSAIDRTIIDAFDQTRLPSAPRALDHP